MPKPTLFVVTDELQKVLDNLPPNETRVSCLEPLRTNILRWRREGRSYRKIQQILASECRVSITYESLRQFVKRRTKPRKPKLEPEFELATQPVNSYSAAVSSVERKPRMSVEQREAARAALRASFETPLFPTEEKKPLFERRPGPIRNLNNEVTKGDK